MSLKFRKLFYYLYIVLFIIAAPLVVLYTAGFRYNFTNGEIAQTGALTVSTIPKGADVFLDNEELGKKTTAIIKRILPATYSLRIEKDGYHSWEREIQIRSRETTNIENAVLFLNAEPDLLLNIKAETTTVSPNIDRFVYATAEDPWLEIWSYDIDKEEQKLLDRVSLSLASDPQFSWSPNGDYLMLSYTHSGIRQFNFYNRFGPVASPFDEIVLPPTTHMYFDPIEDSIIHASMPGTIILGDVRQGTIIEEHKDVMDVLPINEISWKLEEQGDMVALLRTSGGVEEPLAFLPAGVYEFAGTEQNLVLLFDPVRETILLVDTFTDEPPILLNRQATFFAWQEGTLLFSDGFELINYNPSENKETLITRSGDYIDGVAPFPRGETVLLQNTGTIVATDYSDLSRPVNTTILESDSLSKFWVDKKGLKAYFYGTVNNTTGLFSLRLTK